MWKISVGKNTLPFFVLVNGEEHKSNICKW